MVKGVSKVRESIEVAVPISVAYDQWTQFEDFPRFMEGVQSVQQIDDAHMHWRASVGGKNVEWDAEIVEQTPDREVSWRSTSGARNAGCVTFDPLSDSSVRVSLELDYAPEGALENMGDALGLLQRRVKGDLERFKDFIEKRGSETGAWRGRIPPR